MRGLTSVARRTVSVRSPMRMPFRPAHAMSVTLGSAYTTNPYLHSNSLGAPIHQSPTYDQPITERSFQRSSCPENTSSTAHPFHPARKSWLVCCTEAYVQFSGVRRNVRCL